MKTQTNDSLFTNIETDKAAHVNGGFLTAASQALFFDQLHRYGRAYDIELGGWVTYDPWTGNLVLED